MHKFIQITFNHFCIVMVSSHATQKNSIEFFRQIALPVAQARNDDLGFRLPEKTL